MSITTEPNMPAIDYDKLLKRSLMEVFNHRNPTLRRQAIEDLYTADATLFDPDTVVQGWDAIADTVTIVLAHLPADITLARPARRTVTAVQAACTDRQGHRGRCL